jgi:hypothetical protein
MNFKFKNIEMNALETNGNAFKVWDVFILSVSCFLPDR